MIYTELDKITLSRFIDVYLGNINRVADGGIHTKEEKMEAAKKLCSRYLSIVGGKSMLSQISRRNEVLKLQMRISCLDSCNRLMLLGEWKEVCKILVLLGYRFIDNEHEKIKGKIESVKASDRYRMEKIINEEHSSPGNFVMDRTYFTKERVALMSHVKMYIDPDTFMAEEYAWMVRRMCDELDAAIRSTKKKK